MKKNTLAISLCTTALFTLCTFMGVKTHAQDAIYKKDKTKIEGKVLEVGVSEIKYKLASNLNGPTYSITKPDIILITYQNGSHENFSDQNSSRSKFDSLSVNFCRNFIALDVAEFANASVGLVYEHTFGKKGMFALRLPFSVGLQRGTYNYYPYGKIFNTGVDFMFFPTGQGKFRYYAATYLEWGMFKYRDYYLQGGDYYTIYPPYYSGGSLGHHFAGGIKNGLLYQLTGHFSISADFGLGIKYDDTYNYYSGPSIQPHFKGNLIVGYRF